MLYPVILAGLLSSVSPLVHPPVPVDLQGGRDSLNMSWVAFYGGFGQIEHMAVDAARGYLYGSRSAAVDVYDLAQPDNPVLVAEVQVLDGSGPLAYRASDQTLFVGGSYHLTVLDLSSPAQPQIVGSVVLPGKVLDLSLSGNLVLAALGDSGLAVVDAQNPAQPALQGRLLLPFPSSADYVATLGNDAYVSDGSATIYVVDFSTPASPTLVGPIALDGAYDLEVAGNVLVTASNSSTTPGLYLHDLTNPQAPVLLGMYGNGYGMSDPVVSGNTVFVYTTDQVAPMLIAVDITTPTSPSLIGALTLNTWVYPRVIYGGSGMVRLYGSSWDGAHIMDVGNPASMSETAVFGNDRVVFPISADEAGQRLYIAGYYGNLGVMDLTDPVHPVPLGAVPGMFTWVDAISSSAVYAVGMPTSSPFQLYVYDFSNPAQPQQRATLQTSAYRYVRVGTRMYGGFWPDSLEVLDVSNPYQPAVLGHSGLSGPVYNVFPFHGDTLLVSFDSTGTGQFRLKAVDATQPGAAQEIALIASSTTSFFPDVQVRGDTLLVIRDSTLEVLDVSNLTSPTLLGSLSLGTGNLLGIVRTVNFRGRRLAVVSMATGTGAVYLVDYTDPAQMQIVGFYQASWLQPLWMKPVVNGQNLEIRVLLTGWAGNFGGAYLVFAVDPTAVSERPVRGGVGLHPRVVRGAMVFPEGVRGRLTVLDPLGREVMNRGITGGRPVPLRPGVYFWRLEKDRQVHQGRVVILP